MHDTFVYIFLLFKHFFRLLRKNKKEEITDYNDDDFLGALSSGLSKTMGLVAIGAKNVARIRAKCKLTFGIHVICNEGTSVQMWSHFLPLFITLDHSM